MERWNGQATTQHTSTTQALQSTEGVSCVVSAVKNVHLRNVTSRNEARENRQAQPLGALHGDTYTTQNCFHVRSRDQSTYTHSRCGHTQLVMNVANTIFVVARHYSCTSETRETAETRYQHGWPCEYCKDTMGGSHTSCHTAPNRAHRHRLPYWITLASSSPPSNQIFLRSAQSDLIELRKRL